MGAGVFSSDFNGTGETFLVNGPLGTDEDYSAYVNSIMQDHPEILLSEAEDGDWYFHDEPCAQREEGDHSSKEEAFTEACEDKDIYLMDRATWGQEEYDQFNLDLITMVAEAGREFGLGVKPREGFDSDSMFADKEFGCLAGNEFIEFGWRSWEHDFVVGVAAGSDLKEWLEDPETYATDMLERFGLTGEKVKNLYQELVSNMERYLQLSMGGSGFECSYRTSGYTTSRYEVPEEPALSEEMAKLAESIKSSLAILQRPAVENLVALTEEDRRELILKIQSIQEEASDARLYVSVPMFNPVDENVLWYRPFSEDYGAIASGMLPADIIQHMQPLSSSNDLVSIPRDEVTKEWLDQQQRKYLELASNRGGPSAIIATAKEVANAIEADVVVKVQDGENDPIELLVLEGPGNQMRLKL